MASMRDIKRRRSSIQSTEQITKAMKLVATVKLQKARAKAEHSRPYSRFMYSTIASMLTRAGNIRHPYLQSGGEGKKAVIVITANRGLAGGYNNNVVRLVLDSGIPKEEMEIYAVGRKGRESLERRGYRVAEDVSDVINEPLYKDAMEIGGQLLKAYADGEVSEIYLAYTSFKNTVSHIPTFMKLLPLEVEKGGTEGAAGASMKMTGAEMIGAESMTEEEQARGQLTPMNFEPDAEDALDAIIPKYMTSLIYGALLEAVASENGARMSAMDSATSNAEEMIEELGLEYNRARQGSITQELTEIIAGANAING